MRRVIRDDDVNERIAPNVNPWFSEALSFLLNPTHLLKDRWPALKLAGTPHADQGPERAQPVSISATRFFAQDLDQIPDDFSGVAFEGAGDGNQFNYIETPFPDLILGHVRLRLLQLRRECGLCQPLCLAAPPEDRLKSELLGRADRLAHSALPMIAPAGRVRPLSEYPKIGYYSGDGLLTDRDLGEEKGVQAV